MSSSSMGTTQIRWSMTLAILTAALAAGGCKDKPSGDKPAEKEESITGKCKDVQQAVAKWTVAAPGGPRERMKAGVAAIGPGMECQHGEMPPARIDCILAAKSKDEFDKCAKP
jgi:hypothetical protein